ncbi:AAA family ATPase [Streptomyces sp. NPDC101158]|uniref:AAA family ATPase n=1 Tax=Streptomyces sp. NPDC101158 TaxID=3366117 RepID=UPI00380BEE86
MTGTAPAAPAARKPDPPTAPDPGSVPDPVPVPDPGPVSDPVPVRDEAPAPATDEPARYLWARLQLVEERVRLAVAARQAVDPDPDDPYRGQYLTPEAVARVLDPPYDPGLPALAPADPPPGSPLAVLAGRFGLAPLDLDLLLVALAPDLDARFERLYGYLNDDLTRRRPTVGLALELVGRAGIPSARFRLSPGAPLVSGGLVELTEPERPPLSRVLAVPDRVTAHLLGDDAPDPRLAELLGGRADDPAADPAERDRAVAALRTGTGHVHLRARGGDAAGLASAALRAAGLPALCLDAAAFGLDERAVPALARAVAREARLTGGGVVLGPLEALPDQPGVQDRLLRTVCAALRGVPLLTYGTSGWEPAWAADTPVTLPVATPAPDRHAERWRHALEQALTELTGPRGPVGPPGPSRTTGPSLPSGPTGPPSSAGAGPAGSTRVGDGAAAPSGRVLDGSQDGSPAEAPDVEALALSVAAHRLDAGQLRRAAGTAVRTAALDGRPVSPDDLRTAVRGQSGAGLARLARRVEPAVGWDDLVLPPPTHRQLRELAVRARHRDQVLGQWGMRPGGGRGRGVIALFAGSSGTGKTMSAEVVAADLGMDLYVVDLSTVVDKYVGETEKNLERIFTEASSVNAVLLFDEADAIFGKRSEVKDAHDRHANVESAYLLQRMESFDGIAVLTTNLRANLDEAFTRRLDVIADFPVPDAAQRLALWERCLGDRLPRADDLDLDFCAERFELAGGNIRACAVTAAYAAAAAGGSLTMTQLVTAVAEEYRKLGRLVLAGEFGPYLAEVTRR